MHPLLLAGPSDSLLMLRKQGRAHVGMVERVQHSGLAQRVVERHAAGILPIACLGPTTSFQLQSIYKENCSPYAKVGFPQHHQAGQCIDPFV